MKIALPEKPAVREKTEAPPSFLMRALMLAAVLAVTFALVFAIRAIGKRESRFNDTVAEEIVQEMADNKIVLASGPVRRTVADFGEPILLAHGATSRLIVYTAHLSETISVSSEGLGGWAWTSAFQDIEYEGDAQYTVDLTLLSEADLTVNNELKTLTVRIPYAVLDPINIPAEQIRFRDVKKGWAAPKDIKMTAEESTQLTVQVNERMKARLIDENTIEEANRSAKKVVAELLSATVRAVDPEYTVVVVQ